MFEKARLRLTLQYSLIFLLLFWSLSFGIYFWMNKFFGDKQRKNDIHHNESVSSQQLYTEPTSDQIMDELRNILISVNFLLFFSIPFITWSLTGNTLQPVKKSHEKERQFFTDASHDLRTPLAIIYSELELALRKKRTKEEYKNILLSNKEEIDNLIALVENMLFFARQDKKQQDIQKKPIDVTDIIGGRIVLFQKAAQQKNLSLSFTPSFESTVISGNKQLLQRLISTLLDNAIKYTQVGAITIKTIKKSTTVDIIITDTGIGIPKEQQEKVFDRFFRLDASRSEKGYGLGLSIAKQIVTFHNGTISLASHVGKGTTIFLSFPLIKQIQGKNQ